MLSEVIWPLHGDPACLGPGLDWFGKKVSNLLPWPQATSPVRRSSKSKSTQHMLGHSALSTYPWMIGRYPLVDVPAVPVPLEHHAAHAACPLLGGVERVVAVEDDVGQRPVHDLRRHRHLVHRHRPGT